MVRIVVEIHEEGRAVRPGLPEQCVCLIIDHLRDGLERGPPVHKLSDNHGEIPEYDASCQYIEKPAGIYEVETIDPPVKTGGRAHIRIIGERNDTITLPAEDLRHKGCVFLRVPVAEEIVLLRVKTGEDRSHSRACPGSRSTRVEIQGRLRSSRGQEGSGVLPIAIDTEMVRSGAVYYYEEYIGSGWNQDLKPLPHRRSCVPAGCPAACVVSYPHPVSGHPSKTGKRAANGKRHGQIRHLRRRPKKMERETGLEPATSTLARWRSTTELFPPKSLFRVLIYST
jgi:hypothetical protein